LKSLFLDKFLLKQAEIKEKKNPTKEEKMEGNSNPISPPHSKTIHELAIEGQKNLEETIQADYQIHSIFYE
jgi:SepF-like predicted cell division protein (DUF552 family)